MKMEVLILLGGGALICWVASVILQEYEDRRIQRMPPEERAEYERKRIERERKEATKIQVVTFTAASAYENWLNENEGKVEILDTQVTTKKWSPLTGFLTNTKDFTVTYRPLPDAQPPKQDFPLP
jgi:hypothetical protein